MIRTLLGLLGLVLLVAGCSGTTPAISPGSAQPTVTEPASAPAVPNVAAFGQRFTWPDGMAVEVATPAPWVPSPEAAGDTRPRAVLITFTVINGTPAPFPFNWYGSNATQGGETAPEITDIGTGGGWRPNTILPGATYTFRVAYSVGAAVGPMQVEYTYGTTTAIFTGVA